MTAARAVFLSLLSFPATDALAQEVSLASVLERSAAYVSDYRRQLSGIVAEEQYTQDERLTAAASSGLTGGARVPHLHRIREASGWPNKAASRRENTPRAYRGGRRSP